MNWSGLICDGGRPNTVSIGRVLLWITFACMVGHWERGVRTGIVLEAPESLMGSFGFLLLYNLWSKAKEMIEMFLKYKSGGNGNTTVNNTVAKPTE